MNDAEGDPFLQILHVSDLHVSQGHRHLWPDWNAKPWCLLEAAKDYRGRDPIRRARRRLYEFVQDGVARHDAQALNKLLRFLKRGRHREGDWGKVRTWIAFGGDLTTFGDDPSFDFGVGYLEALRDLVDGMVFATHGNHDLWPDMLPYFAPEAIAAKTERVRDALRSFCNPPLQEPIPGSNSSVELHVLDTVYPDYVDNTLAVGRVVPDAWTRLRSSLGDRDRVFRILLLHHPIHQPSRRIWKRTLFEPGKVARSLKEGGSPLVHLVLGGHTHQLHPSLGELPPDAARARQRPLASGQLQLVIGSGAQDDLFGRRGDFPHQVQLLRFRVATSGGGLRICVERTLVAREGDISTYGDFYFVEDVSDVNAPVQATVWTVR